VPQVLISVGRRYLRCIKHFDARTGTLGDGRYRSSLVRPETLGVQKRRPNKPPQA
jgi:hypothetical protein